MIKSSVLGKARFTVITENLVRAEFSYDKTFTDDQTLFAINRDYNGCEFNFTTSNNSLTVSTPFISLTYIDDDSYFFTPNNLFGKFGNRLWKYGDNNKNNLGGTLSTLDCVEGYTKIDDGLLSKDGWFIYDDIRNPALQNGWLKPGMARTGNDLYIFSYGNDYQKALDTLFYVSGKVPIPRKYVLGSWYSRWHPYTDKEILQIIKEYDEHDFPLDVMVLDMDWHHNSWRTQDNEESRSHQPTYGYGHATSNLGWTGYSWNKNLIPNPKKLMDALHEENIAVTLNDHPHDGIRTHEDTYDSFMKELGLPSNTDVNLEFDASNKKYMTAFFNNAQQPLLDVGVDFMWLDWQQDDVKPFVKGTKMRHIPWLNYLYFNKLKNGKRPISYSRYGGLGDHKHPIYFSGDTTATWECLSFEITFTATSSNVGLMYWGHDTGGFCVKEKEPRNPELYVRWTQFSSLSSCLRVHSVGDDLDRRPWVNWGEKEMEAMRDAYHLRSELFPYIYSLTNCVYENGKPMICSTYFYYPNDKKAYKQPQQYFFGENMLVAPVTSPINKNGVAKQKIYIPEGEYYDYFTNKKYTKGTHVFACKLNEYPLLIRAGTPIPMQPYKSRMTSTPLNDLIILCYPGNKGEFTLYEDDGISEKYVDGEWLKTSLKYQNSNGTIRINVEPFGKGYDNMPATRNYTIKLPLTEKLKLINDESAKIEYIDGTNYVKFTKPIKEKTELKLASYN